MEEQFYCKTKYGSSEPVYTKFQKIGDEWEYSDFLVALGHQYNISAYDIEYISDSRGIQMPEEYFINIFRQNFNHPEFILTFKTVLSLNKIAHRQNDSMENEMYFSSEELETFIKESSNAYVLLKKYNPGKSESVPSLSDVERRAVIREAVNLLVKKFTYHPGHEHKVAISLAVIKLFPQLKTQDSINEGVDLLYDRHNNRGYLLNRLCHIRNKLYKTEADALIIKPDIETSKKRLSNFEKKKYMKRANVEEAAITPNIEEDLLILKHLNVNTQKDKIKDKLKTTLNYRKKSIHSSTFSKFSVDFPFFFTSPDLVLYDFQLQFPEVSANFIDNWPMVAKKIKAVWTSFKGATDTDIPEIEDWLVSFQQFFILLKLLPQTSMGKSSAKTKRSSFVESISKIIIFKQLNLTNQEYLQKNITSPYLIACGEDKKAISQYLLCLECEIIPLPINFTFLDSLDLLFKAHYVFNQQFEESIKNVWTFVSNYFFKIAEKCLPSKTRDVINKINFEIAKD